MIGLPIADKDGFDGLRTTTLIVSVCSDSQPKTFLDALWTAMSASGTPNLKPEEESAEPIRGKKVV
jgi:hypothetical protein